MKYVIKYKKPSSVAGLLKHLDDFIVVYSDKTSLFR